MAMGHGILAMLSSACHGGGHGLSVGPSCMCHGRGHGMMVVLSGACQGWGRGMPVGVLRSGWCWPCWWPMGLSRHVSDSVNARPVGLSGHSNRSVNGLLGLSHGLVKWEDVSHLPIDPCHSRNLPRVCTRPLEKSSKARLDPICGPISDVHASLGLCPRAIFVEVSTI
ncbi:hypothetical protein I3842_15G109800 [Carya illinoinensis]|uniref:Secreted protein n=1 Tax=Carya illinoinensis TaxID=32201 RepID=A0A922D6Z3_CARIL|nr:hypothetical protein I3842_15G109800 [Carya illinoinensis]